ncbi:MAG TPA: methionyl-tRNA formyltransferase [Clostridia bacterium]|nr:methionyl-tRNA formyltransferase [Clostridia bacterium]
MLKILFMGTPEFALPCLDYLYHSHHDLLAVVTQPDRPRGRGKKLVFSPVKDYALKHGIRVLQPQRAKEQGFLDLLQGMQLDLIVVVAYGQILSKQLLEIPKFGCLNVHASLLPKYRGAAPIHRAVMAGEKETGITTMWMDEGLDTGDIFLQKAIPIGFDDTTGVVHDKLAQLGAELLEKSLDLIEEGKIVRIPQDDNLSTYAERLTKKDEMIDWSNSAEVIYNQVRGMSPWPGTYVYYKGKRIKLLAVKIVGFSQSEGKENVEPGQIVGWEKNLGPIIKTGQGYLAITMLQPAGKKPMTAEAFNLGNKFELGSKLSSNRLTEDDLE